MKRNIGVFGSNLLLMWLALPLPAAITFTPAQPNIEQEIIFRVANPQGVSEERGLWDFGDGTPQNWDNSTVRKIYRAVGTYLVKATYWTQSAVKRTDQVSVTVVESRAITFSPTQPVIDGQTTFRAVNFLSNNIRWNFGDGTASQCLGALVTHTYQSIGTFTVTAADWCGDTITPISIQVKVSEGTGPFAPFQIKFVRLRFENTKTYHAVPRNFPRLEAYADIEFVGSGTLTGQWLVDGAPFRQFNQPLTYTQIVTISSGKTPGLPCQEPGLHQVTLQFSQPPIDFSLPIIQYFVETQEAAKTIAIHGRVIEDKTEKPLSQVTVECRALDGQTQQPRKTAQAAISDIQGKFVITKMAANTTYQLEAYDQAHTPSAPLSVATTDQDVFGITLVLAVPELSRAPRIDSMLPDQALEGDQVNIRGQDLTPIDFVMVNRELYLSPESSFHPETAIKVERIMDWNANSISLYIPEVPQDNTYFLHLLENGLELPVAGKNTIAIRKPKADLAVEEFIVDEWKRQDVLGLDFFAHVTIHNVGNIPFEKIVFFATEYCVPGQPVVHWNFQDSPISLTPNETIRLPLHCQRQQEFSGGTGYTIRLCLFGNAQAGEPVDENPANDCSEKVLFTVAGKPLIGVFAANPAIIKAGESSEISWQVAGTPLFMEIKPDVDIINEKIGKRIVTPLQTTVYTMRASNDDGTDEKNLTLEVKVKPTIMEFNQEPNPVKVGTPVALKWKIAGNFSEAKIWLEGGQTVTQVTQPEGMLDLTSHFATRYFLTVRNADGMDQKDIWIKTFRENPVIDEFKIDPATVILDQSAAISWKISGNYDAAVIRSQPWDASLGSIASASGSMIVHPRQDTKYELSVEKKEGVDRGGDSKVISLTVTAEKPVIESFTASADIVEYGSEITLKGRIRNAYSAAIEPDIGSLQLNDQGEFSTRPIAMQDYTNFMLAALGPGGGAGVSLAVRVIPHIFTFGASKEECTAKEEIQLVWEVHGAVSAFVTPGNISLTLPGGMMNINPQQTTTYTMTAASSGGTIQRSSTVRVKPDINRFDGLPYFIHVGDEAELRWIVYGAKEVEIQPGIGKVNLASGSIKVRPLETTTYTLSASGEGGTVSTLSTKVEVVQGGPIIRHFSADTQMIQPGQSTILRWDLDYTVSAKIEPGIDELTIPPMAGMISISPAETTTYTLTATNPKKTNTAQFKVKVLGERNTFITQVSPSNPCPGQTVTLEGHDLLYDEETSQTGALWLSPTPNYNQMEANVLIKDIIRWEKEMIEFILPAEVTTFAVTEGATYWFYIVQNGKLVFPPSPNEKLTVCVR